MKLPFRGKEKKRTEHEKSGVAGRAEREKQTRKGKTGGTQQR